MDLREFGLSEEYLCFIERRTIKGEVDYYTEQHHILPTHKWPEFVDLKLHPWNSSELSYEDHVEAHRLLKECLQDFGSNVAYVMMTGRQEELASLLSKRFKGTVVLKGEGGNVRVPVGTQLEGYKPIGGAKPGNLNHRYGKRSAMKGVSTEDHPCFGTKTLVNQTTGERKRVPKDHQEEGWLPYSRTRGARAWETPAVQRDDSSMAIWKAAGVIYDRFKLHGKVYGFIPLLLKEGIIPIHNNSVDRILKDIREGWNPYDDPQWIEL
jgi:hypothetical protein